MQSSFTVVTDFHQRTFSKHRNVIFPSNDYFCTEKLVNNWNLTSTMLLITIGSMFSGNLRMLNKARDTNAFWASKTLFLSILTYTANVDKATWNTKCNGYSKGYFFLKPLTQETYSDNQNQRSANQGKSNALINFLFLVTLFCKTNIWFECIVVKEVDGASWKTSEKVPSLHFLHTAKVKSQMT